MRRPGSRLARQPCLAAALLALVLAVALAGCGKKGSLQPPPDEPNTFPRTYPRV